VSGNRFRAYGNENWEFDEQELMHARNASVNEELPITDGRREVPLLSGETADDHPGLSDLGLEPFGTVLDEPGDQRSNSTAVSGVEQQIKTFPSVGRSRGSGA